MKNLIRIIKFQDIATSHKVIHSIVITLSLIVISQCCSNIALAQVQLGGDIDGEAANDHSGYSVSLSADGQRLAIGAPGNDGNGDDSGHVRVYEWLGDDWVQLGADIDGEAAGDSSGASVSLSADGLRLVIGAPGNDGNGDNSGHARVYGWSGLDWIQLGADIDGKAVNDHLGGGVSISSDGNRVAIAANADDETWFKVGLVRVYQWTNSEWVQTGDDIRGEQEFDYFGGGVSLSSDGNRFAAGAVQNDGLNGSWSGHARAYHWSGTDWVQLGSDIDGEAAMDHSGITSLSADGNRLAVGAIMNDGGGENSGHVRVYQWTGETWTQLGADLDGTAAFDHFGSAVSLSADGSRLTIGAVESENNAGRVRAYEWSGTAWIQHGTSIVGEAEGDESGDAISLSPNGNRVAIGTFKNDGNGTDSGHVRVFDLGMINKTQINAGMNDAWYNPDTSGQGFFINVFPYLGVVSLAWFTYDTELPPADATANLGDPGHRWLTALGLLDGNQALMYIEMTSGGIFDTPTEVTRTDPPGSDGTLLLIFDSCNSGTVEYDIPSINRHGIVPIKRVVDDNIVLCEALP